MRQEKSVKYSHVTNPAAFSAVEKGLQAQTLQDHSWQERVNKENSIMNLIQI